VAGAVEALARGVDVALEQLSGERAALDPHRPQQAGQGVVGDACRHEELLRVLAELGLGAVREGGAGQVGVHRREVLHADVRLVAPEPQPLEVAERYVAVAVLGLQAEADDVAEAHDALRRHNGRVVRQPILQPRIAEQLLGFLHRREARQAPTPKSQNLARRVPY
jgi:hypothetical protein